MRSLLSLGVLILAACGDPGSVQLGEPIETGVVGLAPGEAFCGSSSGMFGEHTHWSYAVVTTAATGTSSVETVAWSADSVSTSEALHVRASDGSYTLDVAGSRSWGCSADGLLLIEDDAVETTTLADGTTFEHQSSTTYDPPYLYVPTAPGVGSAWVVAATGTSTLDGEEASFAYEVQYSVVAAARIKVPAGGFDTLEVLGVTTTPTGDYRDHRFIADSIGAVRIGEDIELTGYRGE